MSKKYDRKGCGTRRIIAGVSVGIMMVSVCIPALQEVTYAEISNGTHVHPGSISENTHDVPQPSESSSQTESTPPTSSQGSSETGGTTESTGNSSGTVESTGNSSSNGGSSNSHTSTTPSNNNQSNQSSKAPNKQSNKQPSKSSGKATKKTTNSKKTNTSSSSTSTSKSPKEINSILDGIVSFGKNSSTEQFIELIGEDASKIAEDNDLYASVMIAQAILESASGNSSLAKDPNYNLFGIKGSYKGKSVGMSTVEDNKNGKRKTIDAKFRKYPSYKESLEDYAKVLKGSTGKASDFYRGAWKSQTKNYREATKYLTGRYATDTRYNQKLNGLIETYDLQRFDNIKKVKKQVKITRHKVVEGENLWTLAAKYGTTINKLNELNKLIDKNNQIKPNDVVIVKYEIVTDEKDPKKETSKDAKDVAKKQSTKEEKELILIKASQLANSIKKVIPSALSEGQTAQTSEKNADRNKTYLVEKDDTLNSIAKNAGVSVSNIMVWNDLKQTKVTEGQVLLIAGP